MPQRGGNGLAMRAGLMLEGLARRFDVSLFVAPVSGGSLDAPDFVRALVWRVGVLDLKASLDPLAALVAVVADPGERRLQRLRYPRPWAARFSGLAAARQVAGFIAGVNFDVLHVMRLYLAPLALHVVAAMDAPRPAMLLDLDDDDARVHERLAELHTLRGDIDQAQADRAEAARYSACAAAVLSGFDAVLTASQADASRLGTRYPAVRFASVPNAYAAVPATPRRVAGTPLRLLFVANIGYLPNRDAAECLIHDIMPALRHRGVDARLDIVGAGAEALSGGAAKRKIGLHGTVECLAPWYGEADIAVVPLRAGGGTRIKILEAFAHGVPVISSHIGAEGLEVQHGEHLLLADGADDVAAACRHLAADPLLAASLAANAMTLLRCRYTPEQSHRSLDAIIDGLPR